MRPQRAPLSFDRFSRMVKLPDGPKEGDYLVPESEPAQWHFIQAVASKKYRIFVNVAPSQRGKTLISVLMPWLYAAAEECLSVGYVMPNLDKLAQNWTGKIKPAIIGAGFGSWLPTKGPGSAGGRPAALALTNPTTRKSVVTYFMAGGTGARETSLSSVSPARVVIDEADDFEHAGQIQLALNRLESWRGIGRAFIASTVNTRSDRESHPILDFFGREDATRSRIAHQCPHCGWFQIIVFEQLDLNLGQLRCKNAKCGETWSEDDRNLALRRSKIVHGEENCALGEVLTPDKRSTVFSLLTTGFDYHMADLGQIANAYKVAKDKEALGDYSMMENFSHKVLCVPYQPPADQETITDRLLSLRSGKASYERGYVPDEADRLAVAVDVQGDRCYWTAVASGSEDRRWIVDWGEWFWTARDASTGRPIEPTDDDRHAVLDRVLLRSRDGWPKLDGSVVKAGAVGIDIGYNVGGGIGRWCRKHAGVVAVRGEGGDRHVAESLDGRRTATLSPRQGSTLEADHGFYEVRKQDAAPDQPVFWWFVRTQSLREHVAGRLRVAVDQPGSMMLPFGVAEREDLIKHLAAWAIIRDPDTKMTKWVQVGKRDDYLDAVCYATALLTIKTGKRTPGTVGKTGAK